MATRPGLLTEWPWKHLGSFKYMTLAPWTIQSIYSLRNNINNKRDYTNLLIIPFLLSRALHSQIWISISRHKTAKGINRIVDRSIEFEQVDRESNWDDHILLSGLVLYVLNTTFKSASFMPIWRTDGVIMMILIHAGPVEYVYYWLHRALHHHYLYSRYHSHHHSSIVTQPNSSVIHPFAEILFYDTLFLIPLAATLFTGTASLVSYYGYITYIDFMNNMGHCNFELIPKSAFSIFPPLKYLMYTPSFHSLHHTQFRTNYSLFMPFYDYIHGTMDNSSDALYETSVKRKEDVPDVVHLAHLTTIGWPLRWWYVVQNYIYGRTFIVERNLLENLKLQSWAIPLYSIWYTRLIEEAILEADAKGAKIMSLGLLNQSEEVFNGKHPELKIKVIDGSSLAVAIVLNKIPKGTTQVLFRGVLNKVGLSIVSALLQQGIQVATLYEHEKLQLCERTKGNVVVVSKSCNHKVWIVGDGLSKNEQLMAPKGTLFIPFTHLPPKKARKDAFYSHTPSMVAPPSLQNLHSCENWLPRRVMSAPRVAGIVHALERWNVNECGDSIFDVNKIWEAALKHGFCPTTISN